MMVLKKHVFIVSRGGGLQTRATQMRTGGEGRRLKKYLDRLI